MVWMECSCVSSLELPDPFLHPEIAWEQKYGVYDRTFCASTVYEVAVGLGL